MIDNILLSHEGAIATVTLNRPEKLNAMTLDMYRRFGEVMDEINNDTAVRCVVVTGAGERAFCPGSDISEFNQVRSSRESAKQYARETVPPTLKLWECPHPTVALIRGACVGGGLEIALMCDIRIAGQGSRFGIPINRLGLNLDYDELGLLTDVVGQQAAREILLTGRVFHSSDALRLGLINRAVADDEVGEVAMEEARRIAAGAPLVNRWHKKFLRRLTDPRPLEEAEREEAFDCYDSEDFHIGCRAFEAKKTPEFKGS